MSELVNQFHSSCLVCKSKRLVALKKYAHAHLHKCISCGFIFTAKIPTEKELTQHYTNYPRYDNFSAITIKRYNELLDEFEKFRVKTTYLILAVVMVIFLK